MTRTGASSGRAGRKARGTARSAKGCAAALPVRLLAGIGFEDGSYAVEELAQRYAEAFHDLVERVEPEVSVPLFDISQVASVDACHEGEFLLRDPVFLAKLLYAQAHIVSDIRLHAYRL